MKKNFFILFVSAFVFISCQGDDSTANPIESEPENPQTLLLGKWKKIKREIYIDGSLTSTIDLKSAECDYDYYDLKNDGTKDNVFYRPEENCKDISINGIWSYDASKNIITLKDNVSEILAQTVSLTKTDLKVKVIRENSASPPAGYEVYAYFKK